MAGSFDQYFRSGSFVRAVYRGIQDTRTCIRYFKRSAIDQNNLFGIDTGKICVWGMGTGGYLALGATTSDDKMLIKKNKINSFFIDCTSIYVNYPTNLSLKKRLYFTNKI